MSEPNITIQAYHTSAGSNYPIHRVVIHSTAPDIGFPGASARGQAEATAHYFTEPSSGGSAQYIEDPADEEHCVKDSVIAWHAPPNPGSIGIEICSEATYTEEEWKSAKGRAVLQPAAKRTAELCHRFDLPVVRLWPHDLLAGKRGICGHVDVSRAWHQSDHTDPGGHFPWPLFLSMVQEELNKIGHHEHKTRPVVPGKQRAPKFPGRTLDLGSHGDDVHTYQMQMIHRGWRAIGKADGQFGPKCARVTAAFQKEKRLRVTGRVNRSTWNAAFRAKIT